LRQQTEFAQQGGGKVQFLVQKISVFGIEMQNWMLIVALLVVAFVIFAWRTRDL
jgi:disulfide bond formation protein DsbB